MLGLGLSITNSKLPRLDADAQAFFDRMTTPPTSARKTLYNNLIVTLKADGNWTELDVLVILAAADSQASLLDLKNLSDGALVNAPTFVADRGFTSDGSTSYINTQYNPSTDAVVHTQNDASAGVYIRTNTNTADFMIGLVDAGNNGTSILTRSGADQFTNRLNSDTSHIAASLDSSGLWCINRTANNLFETLKNGSSLGTQADTSQAFDNDEVYVLCRNKIGTGATNFSDKQGAAYFIGSGSLNHATFNTALETFLDGIGAGVQ